LPAAEGSLPAESTYTADSQCQGGKGLYVCVSTKYFNQFTRKKHPQTQALSNTSLYGTYGA